MCVRSAIFWHTPSQREKAIASKDKLQAKLGQLVVTEVEQVGRDGSDPGSIMQGGGQGGWTMLGAADICVEQLGE